MKKAKRIRFQYRSTPTVPHENMEFMRQMSNAVTRLQPAMLALAKTFASLATGMVRAMTSPSVQEELRMQMLYFQSWQRNELADTLRNAGVDPAPDA